MATFTYRTSTDGGVGSKILLSLFFLFFGGMGLFFAAMIVREGIRHANSYLWNPAQCEILTTSIDGIESHAENLIFRATFRYRVNGQEFISSTYGIDDYKSSKLSELNRLKNTLTPGTEVDCFINPGDPARAIIHRANPLRALFLLFPIPFIAIGFGGIYFLWSKAPTEPTVKRSVLNTSARNAARAGTFLGVVFMVIGAGVTYLLFVQPLLEYFNAKNWRQTECIILSSEVRSSHDSDGHTSYSPEVRYQYVVNGQKYQSENIQFAKIASGRSRANKVVNNFREGKIFPCYFNPTDPSEAVLVREIDSTIFFGLIPLAFFFAGFFVYRASRKEKEKEGERQTVAGATIRPSTSQFSTTSTGPTILKPSNRPAHLFLILTFFSLFWNGIVSVFVYQAFKSFKAGSPEYFLVVFLIPFVLIGLLFIGLAVHSFFAMFNPRVTAEISSATIRLGANAKLTWKFTGKVERIQKFTITLEATEEATYRRGTNTHTDRSAFQRIPIFTAEHTSTITQGETSVRIPADTMHSFTALNNKIVWKIAFHGSIARWPDVKLEYPITVAP